MEFVDTLEQTIRTSLPPNVNHQIDAALKDQHPLSKGFPLMNPFHVLLISSAYLISIPIGRAIMKNRKPLELKTFSLLHNGFLILLSLYMCVETIRQAVALNYSVFGNAAGTSPKDAALAQVLWIFFFSKIIEFVDTWIMVLKKNDRQISFLHVYHHGTIFIIWWAVIYYAPGGESYFSAAQNSFVHVLMYTYYFMATLKISVPYKPYITQIQMTQFILNFVQATFMVLKQTPGYPIFLGWILFIYMLTLLALFYNFYRKNFGAKRESGPRDNKKRE